MRGIKEDARMIFHNSKLTGLSVGEDTVCAWTMYRPSRCETCLQIDLECAYD